MCDGVKCEETEGLKQCVCHTLSFCGKKCQKSRWGGHKGVCVIIGKGYLAAGGNDGDDCALTFRGLGGEGREEGDGED